MQQLWGSILAKILQGSSLYHVQPPGVTPLTSRLYLIFIVEVQEMSCPSRKAMQLYDCMSQRLKANLMIPMITIDHPSPASRTKFALLEI
jgi:hypothetical protein